MAALPLLPDQIAPSRLCGLLYCSDGGERHVNLAAGAEDPLAIYVRNALLLARSAREQGHELTLVTNDAARLEAVMAAVGARTGSLRLEELTFALDVPQGIPFHSAHFKLELLRYFAEGHFGDFPALIDIDTVLTRPLSFGSDGEREILWAYDISDQEWGGRPDREASASLRSLAGAQLASQSWFGGEFLAGTSEGFARLWQEVERIWPLYRTQFAQMYRPGDEMVLSAALNRLIDGGMAVQDPGKQGLVARWWSVRTVNAIGSLDKAENCAVLHLPADKEFLASLPGDEFEISAFMASYRAYVAARLRSGRLRSIAAHFRGRRHAPALA